MKRLITSIVMMLLVGSVAIAEAAPVKAQITAPIEESSLVYKEIDGLKLSITTIAPKGYKKGKAKSSIVFYHGGGWKGGDVSSFQQQASYFASQGIVCFLVQYRIFNIHGTSPKESLYDAKSAMRYIRSNASKFNIDPNRIMTAGGSAGGHLASAVTLCPNINESTDDLSIPTVAYANILFNPVISNGPGTKGVEKAYGYDRVAEYWREFSPMHNIRKGVPPTIFMVGDKDSLIPVEVAHEYKRRIEECGTICRVHIYEGQPHGFFNYKKLESGQYDARMMIATLRDAHKFLQEIGVLSNDPQIEEWVRYHLKDAIY